MPVEANICDHCGKDAGEYPITAHWPEGPGRMAIICERECLGRCPIQHVDGYGLANVYIRDYEEHTAMDDAVMDLCDFVNRRRTSDLNGIASRHVALSMYYCYRALEMMNASRS